MVNLYKKELCKANYKRIANFFNLPSNMCSGMMLLTVSATAFSTRSRTKSG